MVSQSMKVWVRCAVRLAPVLGAVVVLGLVAPEKARGGFVYTGTTNAIIVAGASPIGIGNGNLQWGYDNVTGLNDILLSPGGAFGVANNVLGNNVASTSPTRNFAPGTYLYLNQVGGTAPLSGAPFGAGSAAIYGPYSTWGLTDFGGGGPTESYIDETFTSHYTQTTNYVGKFGTYLSIAGFLPYVGSTAIAAVQSEVSFTYHGNTTTYVLAPEVLAIGDTGGGTFTFVALGGGPYGGAGVAYNGVTTGFSALAIDSYSANILAGTTISITSAVTTYADPATISSSSPDLSLTPGVSLPGELFGASSVPEPSTFAMGGTALLALSVASWLRGRRRTA